MLNLRANQSQLHFTIAGLADDTFSLKRFGSHNLGLSHHYSYELTLQTDYPIPPKAIAAKRGQLSWAWGSDSCYLNGIINAWQALGPSQTASRYGYRLTLISPLYPLAQRVTPRTFIDQDVTQIAKQVLTAAGLSSDAFEIKATGSYLKRPFIAQLNESDLDFLERQLALYGLFYTFEQSASGGKLLILDDVTQLPHFPDNTLRYESQSGAVRPVECIHSFMERQRLLPGEVQLNSYFDETPEVDLTATALSRLPVEGGGCEEHYGLYYETPQEGQQLAEHQIEAYDALRRTYIGETDSRGLTIGQRFTLTNHPISALNGDYRVIDLEQNATQAEALRGGGQSADEEGATHPTYHAKFLAIQASQPFRRLFQPKAPFYHTLTATVESISDDKLPHLDTQGRYRVRFDFDQSDHPKGQASPPLRALQPYGGQHRDNLPRGIHFPLHPGTQVATQFINGDLDRPVIIGVISHPAHPSTVTSRNRSQNILRTPGGNELILEDREKAAYVSLATQDQRNQLKLDAKENLHQITMTTKEGQLQLYAKQDLNITTGGSHIQQSGEDQQVTIKKNQLLVTEKGNIEEHAAKDILLKTSSHLQAKAGGAIRITSGKDYQSESKSGHHTHIKGGDFKLKTLKGKTHLHAHKDLTIQGAGNADMFIGQTKHGITITKGGDLNIHAASVEINAPVINVFGNGTVSSGAVITQERTLTLKLQAVDHEDKALAKAYYGVCFKNGRKVVGRLDKHGEAVLQGMPDEPFQVAYSLYSKKRLTDQAKALYKRALDDTGGKKSVFLL